MTGETRYLALPAKETRPLAFEYSSSVNKSETVALYAGSSKEENTADTNTPILRYSIYAILPSSDHVPAGILYAPADSMTFTGPTFLAIIKSNQKKQPPHHICKAAVKIRILNMDCQRRIFLSNSIFFYDIIHILVTSA